MDAGANDGSALLKEALAEYERRLRQTGQTTARSGSVSWGEGVLAVHSDFGPAEQDKDANQDFVLAWVPENDEQDAVRWAVAMADGVTSSFAAEWGAELACWAALAQLIERAGDLVGHDLAKSSIDGAGAAIRRFADHIAAAGDRFRPEDEFPSTWEFVLQEGLLLQTTLTLSWLQRGVLHLAMVGDAGAVLREGTGESRRDSGLVTGIPQTSRVHALGPKNDRISEMDVWREHRLASPSLLALYTDGIRAGVGDDMQRLLYQLEGFANGDRDNPAKTMVQQFAESGRKEFFDNLTLAVVWSKE